MMAQRELERAVIEPSSVYEAPEDVLGTKLTAEEARQGEIILRTPARKAVFVGGIVLAAIVCVLLFYQASL